MGVYYTCKFRIELVEDLLNVCFLFYCSFEFYETVAFE